MAATERLVVTAVLATGIATVTRGEAASHALFETILTTEHTLWETLLYVGNEEFRQGKSGPFPNHQLRISVKPRLGYAAINYQDHEDPVLPNANSFNPAQPPPNVNLIFSGSTGAVFPNHSAISIHDARLALWEWLRTRKRPTCIQWRAY